MKANEKSSSPPITKEEAIVIIQNMAKELGRPPKKSELPDEIKCRIKPLFDKWCYALEETGLKIPSEKVQEKRRKREEHRQAVERRRIKREAKKKLRDEEKKKNAGKAGRSVRKEDLH